MEDEMMKKGDCGCDCEDCKAGNHHMCKTGLCTWKDKESDEEEEE